MQAINCTEEEANTIVKNYEEGFKGTAEFAKRGSREVRQKGYVLINPVTGHKMYWWDWDDWKKEEQDFKQPGFWDYYRRVKQDNSDFDTLSKVRMHFKAASKYDRMARNSPCQGTAAIIMKSCIKQLFDYIVDNNMFNKIKIVCLVHDEIVCEYPNDQQQFPKVLEDIMESNASIYCKKLPIPACAEVSDHWVH